MVAATEYAVNGRNVNVVLVPGKELFLNRISYTLELYSLSDKPSYHQILWNVKAVSTAVFAEVIVNKAVFLTPARAVSGFHAIWW